MYQQLEWNNLDSIKKSDKSSLTKNTEVFISGAASAFASLFNKIRSGGAKTVEEKATAASTQAEEKASDANTQAEEIVEEILPKEVFSPMRRYVVQEASEEIKSNILAWRLLTRSIHHSNLNKEDVDEDEEEEDQKTRQLKDQRVILNSTLNSIYYKQLNFLMATIAGADANRKQQIVIFNGIEETIANLMKVIPIVEVANNPKSKLVKEVEKSESMEQKGSGNVEQKGGMQIGEIAPAFARAYSKDPLTGKSRWASYGTGARALLIFAAASTLMTPVIAQSSTSTSTEGQGQIVTRGSAFPHAASNITSFQAQALSGDGKMLFSVDHEKEGTNDGEFMGGTIIKVQKLGTDGEWIDDQGKGVVKIQPFRNDLKFLANIKKIEAGQIARWCNVAQEFTVVISVVGLTTTDAGMQKTNVIPIYKEDVFYRFTTPAQVSMLDRLKSEAKRASLILQKIKQGTTPHSYPQTAPKARADTEEALTILDKQGISPDIKINTKTNGTLSLYKINTDENYKYIKDVIVSGTISGYVSAEKKNERTRENGGALRGEIIEKLKKYESKKANEIVKAKTFGFLVSARGLKELDKHIGDDATTAWAKAYLPKGADELKADPSKMDEITTTNPKFMEAVQSTEGFSSKFRLVGTIPSLLQTAEANGAGATELTAIETQLEHQIREYIVNQATSQNPVPTTTEIEERIQIALARKQVTQAMAYHAVKSRGESGPTSVRTYCKKMDKVITIFNEVSNTDKMTSCANNQNTDVCLIDNNFEIIAAAQNVVNGTVLNELADAMAGEGNIDSLGREKLNWDRALDFGKMAVYRENVQNDMPFWKGEKNQGKAVEYMDTVMTSLEFIEISSAQKRNEVNLLHELQRQMSRAKSIIETSSSVAIKKAEFLKFSLEMFNKGGLDTSGTRALGQGPMGQFANTVGRAIQDKFSDLKWGDWTEGPRGISVHVAGRMGTAMKELGRLDAKLQSKVAQLNKGISATNILLSGSQSFPGALLTIGFGASQGKNTQDADAKLAAEIAQTIAGDSGIGGVSFTRKLGPDGKLKFLISQHITNVKYISSNSADAGKNSNSADEAKATAASNQAKADLLESNPKATPAEFEAAGKKAYDASTDAGKNSQSTSSPEVQSVDDFNGTPDQTITFNAYVKPANAQMVGAAFFRNQQTGDKNRAASQNYELAAPIIGNLIGVADVLETGAFHAGKTALWGGMLVIGVAGLSIAFCSIGACVFGELLKNCTTCCKTCTMHGVGFVGGTAKFIGQVWVAIPQGFANGKKTNLLNNGNCEEQLEDWCPWLYNDGIVKVEMTQQKDSFIRDCALFTAKLDAKLEELPATYQAAPRLKLSFERGCMIEFFASRSYLPVAVGGQDTTHPNTTRNTYLMTGQWDEALESMYNTFVETVRPTVVGAAAATTRAAVVTVPTEAPGTETEAAPVAVNDGTIRPSRPSSTAPGRLGVLSRDGGGGKRTRRRGRKKRRKTKVRRKKRKRTIRIRGKRYRNRSLKRRR